METREQKIRRIEAAFNAEIERRQTANASPDTSSATTRPSGCWRRDCLVCQAIDAGKDVTP